MGAEKDWYQPNAKKMHQTFFEMPLHPTEDEMRAQGLDHEEYEAWLAQFRAGSSADN